MKSAQKQLTISNVDALMREGLEYYQQESFVKAIEFYKKALEALQSIAKTSKLDQSETIEEYRFRIHYQIALNYYGFYYGEGNLEQARQHCDKILELKYKGNIIDVYELIGKICVKQHKHFEAMKFYDKMIEEIPEKKSVQTIRALNLKCDIYLDKEKLAKHEDEEKENHKLVRNAYMEARRINRELGMSEADSIENAHYYRTLGESVGVDAESEVVVRNIKKAIEILKKIPPNSTDIAFCLANIGYSHFREGRRHQAEMFSGDAEIKAEQYQKSIEAYTEAAAIFKTRPHPIDLFFIYYYIARAAIGLKKYDLALENAENITKCNKQFHYLSDHIKGMVMKEQAMDDSITPNVKDRKRKIEEALKLLNRAYEFDPENQEIFRSKISAEGALIRTRKLLRERIDPTSVSEELISLFISSHSDQAIIAGITIADIGVTTREELARATNAHIVKKEEAQRLESLLQEHGARLDEVGTIIASQASEIAAVRSSVEDHETRLVTVEKEVKQIQSRMRILEGEVYEMKSVQKMTRQSIANLDAKIKIAESINDDELLKALKRAKKEEIELERKEKIINENPDLRDYYCAMLSEINAGYAAAKALQLNQISIDLSASSIADKTKATLIGAASNYAASLAELIPVVGKACAKIVSTIGFVANLYDQAHRVESLVRFADNVAVSPDDFYKIAKILAIELTLAKQEYLQMLRGAKVENATVESLKSAMKQGFQAGMRNFITRKDKTQARLLGISDAYSIMVFLQAKDMKRELQSSDDQNNQSKHLCIANKIIGLLPDDMVSRRVQDDVLIAAPKPKMMPKSADRVDKCCVIL